MHVIVFTSTRGHVYGDEMILSWVRIPEVLVLCERKKCGLPRNRLLGGTVSKTEYSLHGECSHPKWKWPKKLHR
jgi:hypothetical protein